MAQLTELDRISIAVICVYTPALFIAFLLAFRHGFGRSAGWLYLIIFSLARILGSALELAAINDPTNLSLLIGASTLQTIGLSPLVLVMLGLIGRVLESIRQTRTTVITPQHLRLIQILVIVGLILGVVGGVDLANSLGNVTDQLKSSGTYTLPTESIAGLALTVAGYGILVIATVVSSFQVTAAAPGEKRLLLAVALGLPFVLVRLIFACLGTFGSNRNFRVYGGSPDYPNYLLGMAIIMEMIAVAIFEGVGLTLQTIPRGTPKDGIPLRTMQPRDRAVEEGRA